MWPWKPRRKPAMVSAAARHALGLKPEDQAHKAIADALDIPPMPKGSTRIEMTADQFFVIAAPEPTTPAELSPEYHAGLAIRMIDRLDADEHRLTNALDAEQRQHDALMASLHAELAGVRKVRAAYGKVGELLAEPVPDSVIAAEPISFGDSVTVQNCIAHPIKPRRRKASEPSTA